MLRPPEYAAGCIKISGPPAGTESNSLKFNTQRIASPKRGKRIIFQKFSRLWMTSAGTAKLQKTA